MSKKEKESDDTVVKNDVLKDLIKKYGTDCVVSADFILEQKKQVISVSPILDIALSSGIPEGVIVLCSGKSKAGKSTTSLQFAANCQKLGKKVFYLDVEGRISAKNLNGIHGLNVQDITIIRSTQERILSAQDYLTIAEDIILKVPGCLLIIDSSSALCDSSERVEEITASFRSKAPKLLASFCRRIGNIVPVNNTIVFIIQHLISNTSGYGPMYLEDGGNKIVYQADVKIRAKGFSDWKQGENLVGQMVKWDVEFSALGPPGASVESFIRYGHGIDETWEIINLAIDLGIIVKGGAWYSIGERKFQGQQNVWEYLNSNPEDFKSLVDAVKGMTK